MEKARIEHLIVLMLENRSFDHLLGYLDYQPEAGFEGLRGQEAGFGSRLPNGELVFPGPGAGYELLPGPDHSHAAAMRQMTGMELSSRARPVRMSGFALDYERLNPGSGAQALQCFTPEQVPVLSTLAQQFAVCDHWFCSVPGATWPNRNFTHAGTSDGQVDIRLRSYTNKTIFEQLGEARRDWAIYYGGFPPHSLAFTNLWLGGDASGLHHYRPIARLYRAIRQDRLPHYAFVEPDMFGKVSDSQHPSMGGEMDFRAAERLIARLYSTLRENPAVFEKTLLVITYDEHGGFFDHVRPPRRRGWSVEPPFTDPRSGYTFRFDRLGPRVPAVLVSPWIAAGTVDHTVYDHASIPATVRKLFAPQAAPLTPRVAAAHTFEKMLNLAQPRKDLPAIAEPFVDDAQRRLAENVELRDSLAWILKEMIWNELIRRAGPRPFAAGSEDAGGGGDAGEPEVQVPEPLPEDLSAALLEEIGAQLSPQAQETIQNEIAPQVEAQAAAQAYGLDFLEPLARLAKTARMHVERLVENQATVDDAQKVAEWFIRKIEPRRCTLRTAAGFCREQPGPEELREAVEALFRSGDPRARLWLADSDDLSVELYASGRMVFRDLEPAPPLEIKGAGTEQALDLLTRLLEGSLVSLRQEFAKPVIARQRFAR